MRALLRLYTDGACGFGSNVQDLPSNCFTGKFLTILMKSRDADWGCFLSVQRWLWLISERKLLNDLSMLLYAILMEAEQKVQSSSSWAFPYTIQHTAISPHLIQSYPICIRLNAVQHALDNNIDFLDTNGLSKYVSFAPIQQYAHNTSQPHITSQPIKSPSWACIALHE